MSAPQTPELASRHAQAGSRPAAGAPLPARRVAHRGVAVSSRYFQRAETVFALSNGYLGVRGTYDEGRPTLAPGTFVNGFHETVPLPYAEPAFGLARTGQTIVNVPDATLPASVPRRRAAVRVDRAHAGVRPRAGHARRRADPRPRVVHRVGEARPGALDTPRLARGQAPHGRAVRGHSAGPSRRGRRVLPAGQPAGHPECPSQRRAGSADGHGPRSPGAGPARSGSGTTGGCFSATAPPTAV